MSVTVKQSIPAPKALSAADLLAGATKKGKATCHLSFSGGQELAARWLELNAQLAETERELGLARDQVLDMVRPWHEETCARRRVHEATVVIETPSGALRVSFQHRYVKLALEREEHLQGILGDDYERYFKRAVSLKVKKEVAEDPERLDEMVLALAEALGAENFATFFEVEQSLVPTKVYTETRCQLPAETRPPSTWPACGRSWPWRRSETSPHLETTMCLPWFPPAPAPGPASILSLPPDDWVMQPKINGIRVIIYGGKPFTRLGQPLSDSKGAALLRGMFQGVADTLDGEWVPAEEKYYAFDLPDEPGDLDHRLAVLKKIKVPGVTVVTTYHVNFSQVYSSMPRDMVEGVVAKRRTSLYTKQHRASAETRDWLKRRFAWD